MKLFNVKIGYIEKESYTDYFTLSSEIYLVLLHIADYVIFLKQD